MEMVCSICLVKFNPCLRCGLGERRGEESVNTKVEVSLVCDYAVKMCMPLLLSERLGGKDPHLALMHLTGT